MSFCHGNIHLVLNDSSMHNELTGKFVTVLERNLSRPNDHWMRIILMRMSHMSVQIILESGVPDSTL